MCYMISDGTKRLAIFVSTKACLVYDDIYVISLCFQLVIPVVNCHFLRNIRKNRTESWLDCSTCCRFIFAAVINGRGKDKWFW
jgi:hypothetical protein